MLVNPAAGGASPRTLDAVRARLTDLAGGELVELDAAGPAEVAAAARRGLSAGLDRLVVVGGDGLVHRALPAVAGRAEITLGIVALGTGNDIARALGLPVDDPLAAAELAVNGEPTAIDAMRSDAGWALSVATAGFSVRVNERANRLRWPRGAARYQVATLLGLPGLRPDRLVLTVDGVEHRTDATLIAVGNTRFFGGAMAICPDADPCDGLLDVTIVGAVGRLRLLRFFPTVYSGAHRTNPAVTFLRARTVALAGGADVWADGERLGPMPLSLEAVAGAVRVAGARIGATDRAD
ncbi:MAG: YegS/Rv2252/BmrU family lipid kinase [Acidimicrobiales bacterium]